MNYSTRVLIYFAVAMFCAAVGFMVDKIDTSQIQPFGQPEIVKVTDGNGESYYVVRDSCRIYSFRFGNYHTAHPDGFRYTTTTIDNARKFETASMAKQWLNESKLTETVVEGNKE